MKLSHFIAALCVFAQSCSIDSNLNSPCSEPGGWGYATIISPEGKPYRNTPSSKPLNYNEFAFIALDSGVEGYWKYNMALNQKELIAEIDAWDPPDWSVKDWIVFGSNAQIFICKSNEDSLTQLTFGNTNYDPSWSPDGNYIIFERDENDAVQNFAVIDISGNTVSEYKSIIYAGKAVCWSPDGNKIAFISTSNIYDKYLIAYFEVSDPETIHYIQGSDIQYSGHGLLGPIDWYPDSKTILYNENDDIYSVNIESGIIQLVKGGVGCLTYNYHTILADGQTIISVRKESNYDAETNTEYHDYDLVKINPDGEEEIIPY